MKNITKYLGLGAMVVGLTGCGMRSPDVETRVTVNEKQDIVFIADVNGDGADDIVYLNHVYENECELSVIIYDKKKKKFTDPEVLDWLYCGKP